MLAYRNSSSMFTVAPKAGQKYRKRATMDELNSIHHPDKLTKIELSFYHSKEFLSGHNS